jgi:hypothetical protein
VPKEIQAKAVLGKCRMLINQINAGLTQEEPSSMSHRWQSFYCILSLPLLLSKSPSTNPHRARESATRRRSPSINGGAERPASATPLLGEQRCSRPTVGFPVRGYRQRAEGRRKTLPTNPGQRTPAPCYGVEYALNFVREDATPLQCGFHSGPLSDLGCETHQTWPPDTAERPQIQMVASSAQRFNGSNREGISFLGMTCP